MITNLRIRKFVLCLLFAVFGSSSVSAVAEELRSSQPSRYAELEHDLFAPFMDALFRGDINSLKQHLDDEHYARFASLLDQNADYPAYLAEHYKGASFELVEIDQQGEQLIGTVTVYWGDGRSSTMSVPLKEN